LIGKFLNQLKKEDLEMNENVQKLLEFEKIKENIKEYTQSKLGKKRVEDIRFYKKLDAIKIRLSEVSEAKYLIENGLAPNLYGIYDISPLLEKAEKGSVLLPDELLKISDFIRGSRLFKQKMAKIETYSPILSKYALSIAEMSNLEEAIEDMICSKGVRDEADSKLQKLRIQKSQLYSKIEQKMMNLLTNKNWEPYLQEHYSTIKKGHRVLLVKSIYKNKVEGEVIEKSSSGSTLFVEPKSIMKYNLELENVEGQEQEIVYQILSFLTGFVIENVKAIELNVEAFATFDFIYAKAKYAISIKAEEPTLTENEYIMIEDGKHPLIEGSVVPLNLSIGNQYRTLVITGPNTGGKTVVLKTVGLLQLMVQSGLLPPSSKNSQYTVLEDILVDIGDAQNIQTSLSTFSGHMKRLVEIVNKARPGVLILSDEIGTGTDPKEGSALGIAILERLYEKGALTLVTTHYGEIKDFSEKCIGFENARMSFDPETLKPKYKLEIGKSGESQAFWISEQLKLEPKVLKKAKLYSKNMKVMVSEFEEDIKLEHRNKKNKKNKAKKTYEKFDRGDRVNDLKRSWEVIFYDGPDEYGNVVLFNDRTKKYYKEHISRIKLKFKKDMLYPLGYDMDQIFESWEERRFERRVEKGRIKNVKEEFDKLKDSKANGRWNKDIK
jgi:dsDNA-specific endonuclease/ATPase MutS2